MLIYEPVFPHNCKYNINTKKYAFDIIIHMYHDLQPYVSYVLIYSGFKVIEAGIFYMKTSDYFRKLCGRHLYLVHKFDTSVSHMSDGLFANCDVWLVSSYVG